jgi:magnesium-transporting ATPase (P-type)
MLGLAESLAADGYRVLAHAERHWQKEEDLRSDALEGLTFVGFTAMIDPLRPEAAEAVQRCRKAGIEVAMVTGDHPVTAFAISRQLGLADDPETVVTGVMLEEARAESPEALDALVARSRVFARVEPAQKLLIVETLARLGHFVAVTGDGANDAPALRAGHVGVAMAARGTDVAREASTLIVTDDNFASIVAGIEEGRIAYGNVRKVTFLLIATGASEVVTFLSAVLLGLPLPLLPVQLLWLNLVTNGIQDVALAFEPGEGDEMKRPPRDPKERIFNGLMLERIAIVALTMGLCSTGAFWWFLEQGWTEFEARSALLLTYVMFENVLVGASRSENRSALTLNPLRNRVLLAGTLTAFGLHVLVMHWGPMAGVLSIGPVVAWKWVLAASIALIPFAAIELHGWLRRRFGR